VISHPSLKVSAQRGALVAASGMKWVLRDATVCAVAALLVGCGEWRRPARGMIDEQVGTYASVTFGMPRSLVIRKLGRPIGRDEDHGLTYLNAPVHLPGDSGELTYRDVWLSLLHRRVVALAVYGLRARTRRGVAVGDRLAKATRRYRVTCQPAQDVGDRGTFTARCETRLRRDRYLYFGGDPIQVIVLSTEAFQEAGEARR
jgi:hypothetical protein